MAYKYEVGRADNPPSYTDAATALNRLDENYTVQFADFAPTSTGSWGVFGSAPDFEDFSRLVYKANEWLHMHPRIKVLNCESIELKGIKDEEVDYTSSVFIDFKKAQYYLRILRVWYTIKPVDDPPGHQHISYMNWVPRLLQEGTFMHKPKYENFSQTLQRMNAYIQENPLPGKILTVETVDVKMSQKSDNKILPDQSFWKDYTNKYTYYVQCLRVFVVRGEPCSDVIGCADFVPNCTKPAGVFSKAEYENFSVVMKRASTWIGRNPDIRLTNVQSIDCKMKDYIEGPIDSQRSLYREYTGRSNLTMKLRFIRVCYTMPVLQPEAPLSVTCKVFEPYITVKEGGCAVLGEFEPLPVVLRRMHAWFQATGAMPLCAETVPLRMVTQKLRFGAETTYTYPLNVKVEHYLYVVRVFILGGYTEPDPSLLPAVPEPETGCCAIL